MFSGNFAKGFLTGVAESVDREIKADMDLMERRKEKVRDIALERGLTEATRYEQEVRDNLKEIKEMAGALNTDADTIQFLYEQKGSLEATKAYVTQLKEAQAAMGGPTLAPLSSLLDLEQRTDGKTSALQLARYITTPVKNYDIKAAGDIRPGFMKLFGTPQAAQTNLIAEVDRDLAIAGVQKTSLEDIPDPIKGRLAYDWQLSLGRNAASDYANMGAILSQLTVKIGEAEGPQKEMLQKEADAVKQAQQVAANKLTLIDNRGQRIDRVDIKDIKARGITQLANLHGIGSDPNHYNAGGTWIGGAEHAEQRVILDAAEDSLVPIYNDAMELGIDPSRIESVISNARRVNVMPIIKNGEIFIPSEESEQVPLFDVQAVSPKGKPLFSNSPLYKPPGSGLSPAPGASSSSASVLQQTPAAAKIQSAVSTIQNTNDPKNKRAAGNVVMRILRQQNQAMSQADLYKLFEQQTGVTPQSIGVQ